MLQTLESQNHEDSTSTVLMSKDAIRSDLLWCLKPSSLAPEQSYSLLV